MITGTCPYCQKHNYYDSNIPGNPGETCEHYACTRGREMIFVPGPGLYYIK